MNKFKNKMTYIFGGVAIIIGLTGFTRIGNFFIPNLFIPKKVPKEYQNYQSLETNKPIVFGDHRMSLFLESDFFTDKFMSSNKNLIIITYKELEKGSSDRSEATKNYHKLSKAGDIISTYSKVGSRRDQDIIIGDYFINPGLAYYNSWLIDNDTAKKSFIAQNEALNWSETEENILLEKIKKESTGYYKYYDFRNERKNIIFYLLANKWYQFFTNTKDAPFLNNSFGVQTATEKAKNSLDITPGYLMQKKYGSFAVHNGAMQPGSKNVKTLDVDFYCQLYIKNDTLKFKMPIALFADEKGGRFFWDKKGKSVSNYPNEFRALNWPYSFYSNENTDFQLFQSVSYDAVTKFNIYMIRSIRD